MITQILFEGPAFDDSISCYFSADTRSANNFVISISFGLHLKFFYDMRVLAEIVSKVIGIFGRITNSISNNFHNLKPFF